MKPYLLQLIFEKPDVRSTDGNSWIAAGSGRFLTPHCATLGELEWHINQMQAELEAIRQDARRKYAATKTVPMDLGL